MKGFSLICVWMLVAVVVGEKYTSRYDNIDLDEILANRRLLVPYLKCILDEGKCTPDGLELKSHLKEAIVEKCEKCTDAQKSGSDRVIGHLINNEAEYWEKVKAKYDPDNVHAKPFEEKLRKSA